jgi:hypothetical protein
MTLFTDISRRLSGRRERIQDMAGLTKFIETRTSFVTQKCITEFCRVRAGVHWEKLFKEQEFGDALLVSTWSSFTPVLAMMMEMVEGVMRSPAGASQDVLRASLVEMATDIRSGMHLPPQMDENLWKNQSDLVANALARAALAAPRPVRVVASPLAETVFRLLPLHESVVANDDDYIFNNLRVGLLRAHDDFIGSADLRALVRSLTQPGDH